MNEPTRNIKSKIPVKRRSYSIEFKLKIVEEYKKIKNYYALSKQCNISVSSIIDWVNREDEYKQELTRKNRKRLSGAGKNKFSGEFEQELLKWFQNERENKRAASYKQLKLQAERITNNCVTIWWLRGFVRRNSLSMRKITHTEQQMTSHKDIKTEILINYENPLNELDINYDNEVIINMNQSDYFQPFKNEYETGDFLHLFDEIFG